VFPPAAEPAYFVVFQNAEQLRLCRRRHLPDFIEEKRAAVGEFEAANPPFRRSRECSPFVPEYLAFHQRFGYGGTIDGDKRPLGARRETVNGSRENFLARSRLACNQYVRRTAKPAPKSA